MLGFSKNKKSAPMTRRELVRARQRLEQKQSSTPDAAPYQASNASFQRSRTLTGSVSSRIRTPGEQTAHMQSPRVHAHHLMRLRRHIGLALVGSLFVIAFLFVLVSQFTASVAVTIDGDASIQAKADYRQTINQYFAQAPLERLRFFMNDKNFTKYIEAAHPEVDTASMTGANGLGVSDVAIAMRRPAVEWSVNGSQQYVDASGVPFSENYYAEPDVKIVDKSGVRLAPGQTLFSNAFLSFVGRVVGTAKNLEGVTVTSIVIPPRTTHQIEVRVSGVSYPAKLSVDRPAGEQVEDMARTERWLRHQGISPKYIDVRVSGEAYYK